MISIVAIVRCIGIQEIGQLDIGFVIICQVRSIMNRVEGLVIAVYNFRGRGISATVIVRYIAILILYGFGRGGIILLLLVS